MILGFWFGFSWICKCWGTSFLFMTGEFIEENLDKPLYAFASLTA